MPGMLADRTYWRPGPVARRAPPPPVRSRTGLARRNPVNDPFADHDHRGMGSTRPGNARHHRRIHHPQPLDALDPAVLIHDRHRVGIRPHLTGPGYVPGGAQGLTVLELEGHVCRTCTL